jgi:serine phosphatase RsbU (regulator of sigma subunit)
MAKASGTTDGTTQEVPMTIQMAERMATFLGESATLLERVEFTPMPPAPPPPPAPAPAADTPGRRPVPPPGQGRAAGGSRAPRPPRAPGPPPLPSAKVVVDLQEVLAEAEKRVAAEGVPPEVARQLRQLTEQLTPALQTSVGVAGAATRLAAAALAESARERAAQAREQAEVKRQATLAGEALAVPIWREGEMVGRVDARLNLPRTFALVLGSANAPQGEIPFAIDAEGTLHAADPDQRRRLESLDVARVRQPGVRQHDDWIVVTREAPSNVTFGIARPVAQSLKEIRQASLQSLSLGLGAIGLALLGVFPLSRRMTRNLGTLTEGVQRISRGDFSARVAVRSRDEFGALAEAFNRMAHDVEHHQQLVVERERLHRELDLCRRIQTEMLPRAPLRLGATEVKGISIPAREVGGDFFNYFELPGGNLAVLVGDVSGKGISAALLMANIQATLRARLPLDLDLAHLTFAIDREIDDSMPPGVFATLFLGILDPQAKTLRYVNAGHHPQFLVRGGSILPLATSGMPVGLFAGHGYTERCVTLADGDVLFFYTDGLVEVENEAGEMFGAERLEALVGTHGAAGIDALLEHAEAGVRSFRGAAEPFDDLTLMALRLGTTGPSA